MKIAALPVIALLPAVTLGGFLDKRSAECSTVFGAGNGEAVPTSTQLLKERRVVEKTVRVRKTITINPTVTRQNTATVTVTDRITVSRTGTSRTVTVTDSTTSTVSTSSGFVAAASAVANIAAKRLSHSLSHTTSHAAATAASHTSHAASHTSHAASHHSSHIAHHTKREAEAVPIAVNCVQYAKRDQVRTVTVGIKPDATHYGKPHTVTVGHAHTRHIVRTVATTTVHPTHTVHQARATAYAACSSSNQLGWTFGHGHGNATVGGNSTSNAHVGINSVVLVSGTTPKTFDAVSAELCCIRCQLTSGCVGSQWRAGVCSIHIREASAGSCSASVFNFGTFFANPSAPLDANEGLILSNGRCGSSWKYGGFTGN